MRAQSFHTPVRSQVCPRRSRLAQQMRARRFQIRASHTQLFGQLNVGRVRKPVAKRPAGVSIAQHRVKKAQHLVAPDGISTLLKIQIAANRVHQHKILPDAGGKVRDGFHEPHRVKTPFFTVRYQSLQVF